MPRPPNSARHNAAIRALMDTLPVSVTTFYRDNREPNVGDEFRENFFDRYNVVMYLAATLYAKIEFVEQLRADNYQDPLVENCYMGACALQMDAKTRWNRAIDEPRGITEDGTPIAILAGFLLLVAPRSRLRDLASSPKDWLAESQAFREYFSNMSCYEAGTIEHEEEIQQSVTRGLYLLRENGYLDRPGHDVKGTILRNRFPPMAPRPQYSSSGSGSQYSAPQPQASGSSSSRVGEKRSKKFKPSSSKSKEVDRRGQGVSPWSSMSNWVIPPKKDQAAQASGAYPQATGPAGPSSSALSSYPPSREQQQPSSRTSSPGQGGYPSQPSSSRSKSGSRPW